jgi:hypothetical protein
VAEREDDARRRQQDDAQPDSALDPLSPFRLPSPARRPSLALAAAIG